MTRPPPVTTLFPYTTLFRSKAAKSLLTVNGIHLSEEGYKAIAPAMFQGLFGENAPMKSAGFERLVEADRKSTRLNSSHLVISYAVFCLKKKNKHRIEARHKS